MLLKIQLSYNMFYNIPDLPDLGIPYMLQCHLIHSSIIVSWKAIIFITHCMNMIWWTSMIFTLQNVVNYSEWLLQTTNIMNNNILNNKRSPLIWEKTRNQSNTIFHVWSSLVSVHGVYQSVKLHYTVTFQMLHRVVTFEEKYRNLPTLGASYKAHSSILMDWVTVLGIH